MIRREKSPEDLLLAQHILEEYRQAGAVRQVRDPENTKHLVPWFVISKEEQGGMKHRFITDCRELNRFLQPREFRLDHLQTIFPYLRKGWVAAKVDLKDAYFHMQLAPTLSQFVRVQVGEVEWEFLSACFGLSTLPQLFMLLMKVLEKIWRAKGIFVFVYLDDILVLAPSEKRLARDLSVVVDVLLEAGFKINSKKSSLFPCNQVQHLGMLLDFA